MYVEKILAIAFTTSLIIKIINIFLNIDSLLNNRRGGGSGGSRGFPSRDQERGRNSGSDGTSNRLPSPQSNGEKLYSNLSYGVLK